MLSIVLAVLTVQKRKACGKTPVLLVGGVAVALALTVFLVGSVARYERDPFTWKSSSSQLLRRATNVIGRCCFSVDHLKIS